MLCYVFWSQAEYGIVCFILYNHIQTWPKYLAQILLLTEKVGFELIDVSLVEDGVISIMLAFLTNTVPFFSYLSKFLFPHRL